jgi:hypothetical protein
MGAKHCLAQANIATTSNGIEAASPVQIQAFVVRCRKSVLANFGATLATSSDHQGTEDDPYVLD